MIWGVWKHLTSRCPRVAQDVLIVSQDGVRCLNRSWGSSEVLSCVTIPYVTIFHTVSQDVRCKMSWDVLTWTELFQNYFNVVVVALWPCSSKLFCTLLCMSCIFWLASHQEIHLIGMTSLDWPCFNSDDKENNEHPQESCAEHMKSPVVDHKNSSFGKFCSSWTMNQAVPRAKLVCASCPA